MGDDEEEEDGDDDFNNHSIWFLSISQDFFLTIIYIWTNFILLRTLPSRHYCYTHLSVRKLKH